MIRSTHLKLVQSVHEAIVNLDLPELPANQVYRRKLLIDRDVTLPCVIVALAGVETVTPGSFETVSLGYPIVVGIVAAANQDVTVEDDSVLLWRQLIHDFFDGQSFGLSDDKIAWDCRVELGPIVDVGAWRESNVWLSAMTLRFSTTRARTGTA